MVKCSWSDSQISFGDIVYVLNETADAEITASVKRPVYVNKTTRMLHSHRDAQNMQDSYLNRLLRLNIYRYLSISWFDFSVMTYF